MKEPPAPSPALTSPTAAPVSGRQPPALRAAVAAVMAYCLFDLLLPLLHVPLRRLPLWEAVAAVIIPTAVFMLLQLWLSRTLVGLRPRAVLCLLVTAISVGLWLLTLLYIHPHRGWARAANLPLALLRPLLIGLTITVACTFFGALLSRIVREPNVLLPVALVAMPIDYIGAMTRIGFTQNVVAHKPGIVQAVSVPVPMVGGLHPLAFIGPGDALFMAFFFAVVLRLGMNVRGTFWWMYGLLTVAMLLVLTVPRLDIAALVPMGLSVLVANARYLRLKREEGFAMLYAALLVITLVVAFYWYSHAHLFRHH